jgi:hypothetical protein
MLALMLVLLAPPAASNLEKGCVALAEYRLEEAVVLLEAAKHEGPYPYADHVNLYEKLGVAYAYLEKKKEAMEAFDMLLALDPGHALSYTLSPKVTFLFEQVRKKALSLPAPSVDLNWPRDLKVSQQIPIDLEVVSDRMGFMKQAILYTRVKGANAYQATPLALIGPKSYQHIDLAPPAPDAENAQTLQLYVSITDIKGNRVYAVGDPERPREIGLAYEPPEPWYRAWWFWTSVGLVVAAGTGTAVYFVLKEPSQTIHGTFQVQ